MNVKILYLYPDFMSLYGDNGNVRILERRLKDQGFDVGITSRTITDTDIAFDDVDFVYMGSGFESNRNLVAAHLAQFKDSLVKAIDDGVPMLFTGNSYDILGDRIVISKSDDIKGLGIFDFNIIDQTEKRYTGDVVLEDEEKRQLYVGFVNRAGVPKGEGSLAFEVTKVIGNVPLTRDGVRKNNLLGISLIGPLLLKNPKIAESFVKIICERKGAEYKEISYPHSEKSHDKTKKALLNAEV